MKQPTHRMYFRLICPLYNGRAHFEHLDGSYQEYATDSILGLGQFLNSPSAPNQLNLNGISYNTWPHLTLTHNLTASFINESQGVFIHIKLLEFFSQFNLGPHHPYAFTFLKDDCPVNDYIFLHFRPTNILEAIDFDRALFFDKKDPFRKTLQFDNEQDFRQHQLQFPNQSIAGKKLFLSKEHSIWQQDLRSLQHIDQALYMSAKMQQAFVQSNFTGFRFLKKDFVVGN